MDIELICAPGVVAARWMFGMKVLVTDHNLLSPQETAVLAEAGFDVLPAADIDTVWVFLNESYPRLAIFDWNLFQTDGFRTIRDRLVAGGPDSLRWIAIDARHSVDELARAFHVGAADYLAKPFDPRELVARVEAAARVLGVQSVVAEPAPDKPLARELAFLQTLLNNFPARVYFKDKLGRFTHVNNLQAKRLGLSDPAQAIGKTDHDFFTAGHAGQTLVEEQHVLRTGEPTLEKEEKEIWPDGRVLWAATTRVPIPGPGGEVLGTFAVSRDVTERHKAEDDRRFLASIVEASDDAIIGVTPDWKVATWNRGAHRLYGYQASEVIGRSYALLVPADRFSDVEQNRRELERGGRILRFEAEHLAKDGHRFSVLVTISPITDANGTMTGAAVVAHDIMGRKRAEEEAYRSQQMLEVILNTIPQRVFWKDRNLLYLGCNRAFALDAGLHDPTEVVGKTDFDLVWAASADLYRADDSRVMSTERPKLSFDEEQRLPDGELLWLRTNKMPLRDRSGSVVGVLGTYEDITAHKRAEQALEEDASLATLRAEIGAALTRGGGIRPALQECAEALVRSTGVAFARIWTLEPSGDTLILDASAGIYTHIDGPHGRVPFGHFKIGLIAGRRRPHFSNDVQNDPEVSDHAWARRERMVSFVGHPLVVEESVVGVVGAFSRQPLTNAVRLAFSSVADQIARFIHGKRAQEALQRSEERARLLFASIPHPAYVFDLATLDFLEVNDVAVKQYGYSRDEFLRMQTTALCAEGCGTCHENPVPLGSSSRSAQREWQHRTRDGRTLEVEINLHALEYDGRPAALAIVQDVTERRKLELDLRHAQKLEAVGGLAAGIAHEINTPIQFVGDNLRFLQDAFGDLNSLLTKYRELAEAGDTPALLEEMDQAADEADTGYLLEEIPKATAQSLDGVERVATIVRAMKEFAHPEQKEKVVADLNQALTSTLVVARNEVKYVADVETDYGDLPAVECHLGDLNQVFLNLLVNAAHAVKDVVGSSGDRGTIRVQTRREGDWVKISISDTGGGIPENIRSKVFDPFFTTKPVGSGTGQGLAIARSIVVDKHEGTLTFESEIGRGTTFVIGLPIHHSSNGKSAKR